MLQKNNIQGLKRNNVYLESFNCVPLIINMYNAPFQMCVCFFWKTGRIIYKSDRRQSKTLILSTNVDQKLLETEFSIAIFRPNGDKWQSKTLFLAIFGPCSSIVKSVFDCRLSRVI